MPVVLCYFESLTHEQATGRLGWPVGTVKTRLTRVREQLRRHLVSRGWNSTPLVLTESLRPQDIVQIPRVLVDSTTQAAASFVAGADRGGLIAAAVLAATQGVLKAMLINHVRIAATTFFGLLALGLGAMATARQPPQDGKSERQPKPVSSPATDAPRHNVIYLAGVTSFAPEKLFRIQFRIQSQTECRVDSVHVTVGRVVKKGDPILEIHSTNLATGKRVYENAYREWRRAKDALDLITSLGEAGNLTPRERFEARQLESEKRSTMKAFESMLRTDGLNEEEIKHARSEDADQQAKRTIRAPGDGRVIELSAVPSEFYEGRDPLLTIAKTTGFWLQPASIQVLPTSSRSASN